MIQGEYVFEAKRLYVYAGMIDNDRAVYRAVDSARIASPPLRHLASAWLWYRPFPRRSWEMSLTFRAKVGYTRILT